MTEWPWAGVRVSLTNTQAKGDRAKQNGLPETNSTQQALNLGIVPAVLSDVLAECYQSSLVN